VRGAILAARRKITYAGTELDDSDQYVDRSCGQTDPRCIHFQSEKVRPSAILRLRRQKSVNGLVKKMSAAVSTRLLAQKDEPDEQAAQAI
jgi:hypothetical protein